MFSLDGNPRRICKVIQDCLGNFPHFNPGGTSPLICTVYRRDPLDRYLFTTAFCGLSEVEPMFGPFNWEDLRTKAPEDRDARFQSPFGFRAREAVKWHRTYKLQDCDIHLSGRMEADNAKSMQEEFEQTIKPIIEKILEVSEPSQGPIYPELWHKERLARDLILERMRGIRMSLLPAGNALAEAMSLATRGHFGIVENHVGIYLNTGSSFRLIGNDTEIHLPLEIPSHDYGIHPTPQQCNEMNAFEWVCQSTRPALIGSDDKLIWGKKSQKWLDRIIRSHIELHMKVNDPTFRGMVIVPIPDLSEPTYSMDVFREPSRSWGVILAYSMAQDGGKQNERFNPAHAFLFSRIARVVASYLTPLHPLPRCRFWLGEARWRGRERLEVADWSYTSPNEFDTIKSLLSRLLREDAVIKRVQPLIPGYAGKVFRIEITDGYGIPEVPRVLKFGDPNKILREWQNYQKYVRNKRVGGSARLEVAGVFPKSELLPTQSDKSGAEIGALVYHFVGAGEQALPFEDWAKSAHRSEIERGLSILHDHLSCWHGRHMKLHSPIGDVLISRPLLLSTHFYDKKFAPLVNTNDYFKCLQLNLDKLSKLPPAMHSVDSSVIHGDLHSGNIFAVLGDQVYDQRRVLNSVALIDWGNVSEEGHPLLDISYLVLDLVYRVVWSDWQHADALSWAKQQLERWGTGKLPGFGEANQHDNQFLQALSLIHWMTKIIVYEYQPKLEGQNYRFQPNAIEQMKSDLNNLLESLGVMNS